MDWRSGKFDPDWFGRELALRGIAAKDLCERTGVSEQTIGKARRGVWVKASTVCRIRKGLLDIPRVIPEDEVRP